MGIGHSLPASQRFKLVASGAIAGAAATSLTISGLDLTTAGNYLIEIGFKSNDAGATTASLFVNGDTTVTNYWTQYILANDILVTSARVNDAKIIWNGDKSWESLHSVTMKAGVGGKPMAYVAGAEMCGDNQKLRDVGWMHNNATNVTSLTLTSSAANGLAIGTNIKIYSF